MAEWWACLIESFEIRISVGWKASISYVRIHISAGLRRMGSAE